MQSNWLVITDVMTEEGMTVEVHDFYLRAEADLWADAQVSREEVERVIVCPMPKSTTELIREGTVCATCADEGLRECDCWSRLERS